MTDATTAANAAVDAAKTAAVDAGQAAVAEASKLGGEVASTAKDVASTVADKAKTEGESLLGKVEDGLKEELAKLHQRFDALEELFKSKLKEFADAIKAKV